MSDPNAYHAAELRHVQSSGGLTPSRDHRDRANRLSQHLRTSEARLGSRSPNSIPSSPTSVHSSSSAIFERDIEPIVSPSSPSSYPHHPHHPPNPHRIPRSKTTEQIEQAVPSVLDSAAAILASLEDADGSEIAVLAPATSTFDSIFARSGGSGFASPIGSFRSRSPSPVGSRSTGTPGILLSLPNATSPRPLIQPDTFIQTPVAATSSQGAAEASALVPPSDNTSVTPSIITPTTVYFTSPSSVDSSPLASSRDIPTQPTSHSITSSPDNAATQPLSIPNSNSNSSPSSSSPPHLFSGSPTAAATAAILAASVAATATINPHANSTIGVGIPTGASPPSSSHPPSPHHPPTKRLSFMSYSDLLTSTPASTLPLSSLTTSALATEPPPHIPSVSGFTYTQAALQGQQQQVGSAAASVRGLMLGGFGHGAGAGSGRVSPGLSSMLVAGQRDSIVMVDDVGGEWEREGLGRGLEERLEALMPTVPTRS